MAELPSNNKIPQKYAIQELHSSVSNIDAAFSGIASGLIKIPEGFISLGAELIDLGFDTNTALEVEKIFDTINPFEERASEKAIGKITEAITQVASVGTMGWKLATKAFDKALKAKKVGKYVNLKNPKLKKAADKAASLNKTAKAKRFAAGVVGGAVGETFVADVEKIGTFGDMFENGPTQLETDEIEDPSEDAFRKLMNRAKFGSESIF